MKDYIPVSYDASKEVHYEWETNPEWEYFPFGEKGVAVDKYDITVKSENGEENYPEKHYCLIRDVHGTTREYMKKNMAIPIFDQVGKKVFSLYPVDATYTARFDLSGKENMMVIEGETFAGKAEIYLNGKKLSISEFENKLVYDFKNLVLNVKDIIKAGENILKIEFTDADEFDGLRSRIYFLER